jgi:hypothetical protein
LAERHPYSPGPGGITAAINQLRKSFPKTVSSDTLKQLGIAPKNESYVINVLRFIGAIDKDGNRIEKAATVFLNHNDEDFQKGFEELVKDSYSDLFALHKDATWNLGHDKLIAFFRNKDKTTDLVGKLQATTFQLLAGFAGHGTAPTPTAPKAPAKPKAVKPKAEQTTRVNEAKPLAGNGQRDFGLTLAAGRTGQIFSFFSVAINGKRLLGPSLVLGTLRHARQYSIGAEVE